MIDGWIDFINLDSIKILFSKTIDFVNSNFFAAFVGSGFGAYAGAAAILKMGKKEKLSRELSETNSGLIVLSNTLGKLISLKKIVKPIFVEMTHLKNTINSFSNQNDMPKLKIQLMLQDIIEPRFTTLDKVFYFICSRATINHQAITMCLKSMENIAELNNTLKQRNQLLESLHRGPEDILNKIQNIIGKPSTTGETNNKLYDYTAALDRKLDESIFFTNYAFLEFRKLALSVFSKKIHRKIIDIVIDDMKDREFIPPHDFIPGYYDKDIQK